MQNEPQHTSLKTDRRRRRVAIPACCWAALSLSFGLDGVAGAFDQMDTWTAPGTGAWTNGATGATALSNPGGRLNVQCPAQALPAYVQDIIRVPIPAGVLVTNLAFRFRAERVPPSALQLVLHARHADRLWLAVLPVPAVGQDQEFSRAVAPSAGWTRGVGLDEALWARDVTDVDYVGVRLARHGDTLSQDYAIDDFHVSGTRCSTDEDGDGMDDAWEAYCGLSSTSADDAAEDADGDGMTNYAEFRAGTDPCDAGSQFVLHVEQAKITDGGVILGWESIPNRWYTISRSVRGVGAFGVLASGIPSETAWMTYVDASATNAGPYFYRVEVEP